MQEDRCLLILINTPEDLTGLADAIPKASSRRKRADILPGSCIRLQPLAPSESESATMPLFQLDLCAWSHTLVAEPVAASCGTDQLSCLLKWHCITPDSMCDGPTRFVSA